MIDATRKPIKGFDLPKMRPINRHGNSTAIRELIPRLHRTIRDMQNIHRRHHDSLIIQSMAMELISICKQAVSAETEKKEL